MFDIDLIIPCYGKPELINRGLASIATQWKKEYIHVTLVNDCSPNTDCNYQDLVDRYKNDIDIRCITTPENIGQGLTRQYGIDHTTHEYFMFMDEDDQIGNGLAISLFVGAVEGSQVLKDANNNIIIDLETNKPAHNPDAKKIAIVSGPVFEFDDNHTKVIEATNRVWVNSKLYNRDFINEHNIRFNKEQSRHAEDYYWMSCFFYALDNDTTYSGLLLNNDGLYYLWYPNQESQSRKDPDYGYMLSGYTMNGSVNILKYIKSKECNVPFNAKTYDEKLLNMTMYSYFTFLAFLRHVSTTDYVPTLEDDWNVLRASCDELRRMLKAQYHKYNYTQKIEEYYKVKNYSDVIFTEPWIDFDTYVNEGYEALSWNYNQLLKIKDTMLFDEEGNFVEHRKE